MLSCNVILSHFHQEPESISLTPLNLGGLVTALSNRRTELSLYQLQAYLLTGLVASQCFLLEASHHVRQVITSGQEGCEKPKPCRRASQDETPYKERQDKEHQGIRYMNEEVILEVDPPAPAAPGNIIRMRGKPSAKSFPSSSFPKP